MASLGSSLVASMDQRIVSFVDGLWNRAFQPRTGVLLGNICLFCLTISFLL